MSCVRRGPHLVVVVLLLLFAVVDFAYGQTGTITGTIVDAETGEPLIGANVIIKGTTIGSTTNLDGHYTLIRVDAGVIDVVVSYIGYVSKTVLNVEIAAGTSKVLHLSLAPETVGMEEVVVEAEALRNSDVALLRDRQEAGAVSDAVSAEAMVDGIRTAGLHRIDFDGSGLASGAYLYVLRTVDGGTSRTMSIAK